MRATRSDDRLTQKKERTQKEEREQTGVKRKDRKSKTRTRRNESKEWQNMEGEEIRHRTVQVLLPDEMIASVVASVFICSVGHVWVCFPVFLFPVSLFPVLTSYLQPHRSKPGEAILSFRTQGEKHQPHCQGSDLHPHVLWSGCWSCWKWDTEAALRHGLTVF